MEGVLGQPPSIVQATARHTTSSVFRSHKLGYQFGFGPGAGLGTKTNILCKQGVARA